MRLSLRHTSVCLLSTLLSFQFGGTSALDLDVNSVDSIKQAASTVAYGMAKYYTGNQTGGTPGYLPDGYYWWEAGAMMWHLIDYWHYTGDSTYNDIISQAILFQAGPNRDFMPANQTKVEGNDDQDFWAFAALAAAEDNFPDPPSSNDPSWISLVQATFNEQVERWDTQSCGGGLRWQIYSFMSGWTYKQAVANGGFFTLAARLARYTGNQTYADWADKIWDWTQASPIMSPDMLIYDGTSVTNNCSDADHTMWSYNQGSFLIGAATMYNYTNGSSVWQNRTQNLMLQTWPYFSTANATKGVMTDPCENTKVSCNTDQVTFRSYLARWMAMTTQLAPFTTDYIMPLLQTSAEAAAKSCSGGTDGVTCGMSWIPLDWDGFYGVGEQMSALAVIQALLVGQSKGPLTLMDGATSKSDPDAGLPGDGSSPTLKHITSADRGGAWFLTVLVIGGTSSGLWWLLV